MPPTLIGVVVGLVILTVTVRYAPARSRRRPATASDDNDDPHAAPAGPMSPEDAHASLLYHKPHCDLPFCERLEMAYRVLAGPRLDHPGFQ